MLGVMRIRIVPIGHYCTFYSCFGQCQGSADELQQKKALNGSYGRGAAGVA